MRALADATRTYPYVAQLLCTRNVYNNTLVTPVFLLLFPSRPDPLCITLAAARTTREHDIRVQSRAHTPRHASSCFDAAGVSAFGYSAVWREGGRTGEPFV